MPRKKKKIIQCQEEVCKDKRSNKNDRPINIHQCILPATYVIGVIELYVCKRHAIGIDEKQLQLIK